MPKKEAKRKARKPRTTYKQAAEKSQARKPRKSRKKRPNPTNDWGLTQHQHRFALSYHELGDATAAYRKAYPRSRKWKRASVQKRGSELLKNPKVSRFVAFLQEEDREESRITRGMLVEQLYNMIFTDRTKIAHYNGKTLLITDFNQLTKAERLLVESVELYPTKYGDRVKVTFPNRLDAIRAASRLLGYDVERHKLESDGVVFELHMSGEED